MREKWSAQNSLNFSGSDIFSLIFLKKNTQFGNAVSYKFSSASAVKCICTEVSLLICSVAVYEFNFS